MAIISSMPLSGTGHLDESQCESVVSPPPLSHSSSRLLSSANGFTLIELVVVTLIIAILAAIGLKATSIFYKKAYVIVAKQDLRHFIDYEEANFQVEEKFIGHQNESIRNDGTSSDFELAGFTLSDGVCITITNGAPETPYDSNDPFIVTARHNRLSNYFEYNFSTGIISEKDE